MSKYILLMFGAIVGAFSHVYAQATRSAAASRAWVENYVSNYVAQSAGEMAANAKTTRTETTTTIEVGGGVLTYENPTDAALMVTNATTAAVSAGITNGLYFVWAGGADYINPAGTVTATATNMTFNGVGSVAADGGVRFPGWFDAFGVLIQPSVSLAITNGMTEVTK